MNIIATFLALLALYLEIERLYERHIHEKDKKQLIEMLVRKEAPESLPPQRTGEHVNMVRKQQRGR